MAYSQMANHPHRRPRNEALCEQPERQDINNKFLLDTNALLRILRGDHVATFDRDFDRFHDVIRWQFSS